MKLVIYTFLVRTLMIAVLFMPGISFGCVTAIYGFVYDSHTGEPIPKAEVWTNYNGQKISKTAWDDGAYLLNLPCNHFPYELFASASGYRTVNMLSAKPINNSFIYEPIGLPPIDKNIKSYTNPIVKYTLKKKIEHYKIDGLNRVKDALKKPDYIIDKALLKKSPSNEEMGCILSVRVKNIGKGALDVKTLRNMGGIPLYIKRQWAILPGIKTLPGAGFEKSKEYNYSVAHDLHSNGGFHWLTLSSDSLPVGKYFISATIDPKKAVLELNEKNNTYKTSLTCEPSTKPGTLKKKPMATAGIDTKSSRLIGKRNERMLTNEVVSKEYQEFRNTLMRYPNKKNTTQTFVSKLLAKGMKTSEIYQVLMFAFRDTTKQLYRDKKSWLDRLKQNQEVTDSMSSYLAELSAIADKLDDAGLVLQQMAAIGKAAADDQAMQDSLRDAAASVKESAIESRREGRTELMVEAEELAQIQHIVETVVSVSTTAIAQNKRTETTLENNPPSNAAQASSLQRSLQQDRQLLKQLQSLNNYLGSSQSPGTHLADLLPVNKNQVSSLCDLSPDRAKLRIHILNRSATKAERSKTKVVFLTASDSARGRHMLNTAFIDPGKIRTISVTLPRACNTTGCSFEVTSDAASNIRESNEQNNTKRGNCSQAQSLGNLPSVTQPESTVRELN